MSAIWLRPAESAGCFPSGTVTFTYTDIEGSTRRCDGERTATQDAVRRNEALMCSTITGSDVDAFKAISNCADMASSESSKSRRNASGGAALTLYAAAPTLAEP